MLSNLPYFWTVSFSFIFLLFWCFINLVWCLESCVFTWWSFMHKFEKFWNKTTWFRPCASLKHGSSFIYLAMMKYFQTFEHVWISMVYVIVSFGTYAMEFVTLWTCTYALDHVWTMIGLLWVTKTLLNLFETFLWSYLCIGVPILWIWTMDSGLKFTFNHTNKH